MRNISRITTIAFLAIMLTACALFAPQTVWIDVRSHDEYNEDHISNTEHIPHSEIVAQISDLDLDCRSGVRAGLALTALQDLGYTNVENVGGIADARVVLSQ
jgi:phage shock protein E